MDDSISELKICNIPQQYWEYFTEEPKQWNHNKITYNQTGLWCGIEAVLSAPMVSKPIWIQTSKQQEQFEELKEKFQLIKDSEDEVERFKTWHEEDDSNFIIYFKGAENDATEIKRRLIKTCRELA